jgi:hypothetical protein
VYDIPSGVERFQRPRSALPCIAMPDGHGRFGCLDIDFFARYLAYGLMIVHSIDQITLRRALGFGEEQTGDGGDIRKSQVFVRGVLCLLGLNGRTA